jgi:small subunit ribosomal protein S17
VRIIECPPISKRKTWTVVNRNGTPMGEAAAATDAAPVASA